MKNAVLLMSSAAVEWMMIVPRKRAIQVQPAHLWSSMYVFGGLKPAIVMHGPLRVRVTNAPGNVFIYKTMKQTGVSVMF